MPELPEVETVRQILIPIVKGKKISSVDVLYPRMILNPLEDFKAILKNSTFIDVNRKGKYLLFELDNGYILISHLRMEGKYILLSEGEKTTSHARVIFHLKPNTNLAYDDTRCFGIMKLVEKEKLNQEEMIRKLGPEPMEIKDISPIYQKLLRLSEPIKTAIMDQSIIAGLGNIYADEVLFLSKINPLTPANQISKDEIEKIIKNACSVLKKAIKLGGSTVKSYHAARGVDGKFQNELLAYGKKDSACPICSYPFKKIFINGRGTTYCPVCQKFHFKPIVVAIYGKIASGKSLALNHLHSLGYQTISCDEIVHQLYQNQDVILKVSRLFKNVMINGNLDFGVLNEIVSNDEKKKKRLTDFIHPLVEEKLISRISKSQEKIIFIEVPLLFEANLDYIANYIIGINTTLEKQIENLKKRGVKNVEQYLLLNSSNSFDQHQNDFDYLTSKDATAEELKDEITKIVKLICAKEKI